MSASAFRPETNRQPESDGGKGQIERLQAELRAAHEEFQQFALHASHDFQESLRAVKTFSQLLAEERGEEFSERERLYLDFMLSGTERMRDLLDYILIYSQSTSDNLSTYGSLDVGGIVEGALKHLGDPISRSGAHITLGPSWPTVWANLRGLRQVITSLVSNAIKYRKPDGSLEIRIEAAPHGPGEWKISVRDNGIGIAEQYHKAIFAPFKRLHGKSIPGCGMGLAVCRRIVEAHGGRIWVESTPGGGCDFQFTLRETAPEPKYV